MPGDVLVLEQAAWGSPSCVPSCDPPTLLTPMALGQDESPQSLWHLGPCP